VHARQSVTKDSPLALLNVPMGHAVGADEPAGQYEPAGQRFPVVTSTGVEFFACKVQ